MTPLQALEAITALNEPVDESIYNEAINVLRQALTPPTADEVCEAIKKYLDEYDEYYKDYKVRYSVSDDGLSKSFEAFIMEEYGEYSETICGVFRGASDCNFGIPITNIKLVVFIVRFYEAQQ